MIHSQSTQSRRVDDFVDHYERARAVDPDVALAAFLPNPSDPDYASVAVELMRVDLECRWDRGVPKGLHEYREAYSDLLSDPASMHELAFEEYRLRLQSGEAVEASEYIERYRIDANHWPQTDAPVDAGSTVRSFADSTGDVARLADAVQAFPDIGESLGPFRLVQQIGQGTFGRVYRASQTDLASRHVALKITTTRSLEPDRLARLQHTNIVPIYSIHQHDALYAICMPLLGTITFADAVRERRQVEGLPESGDFFVRLLPPPSETPSDDVIGSSPVAVKDFGLKENELRRVSSPLTSVLSPVDPLRGGGEEAQNPSRRSPSPVASATSRLDELASMSFVEACVLLASELADGLAHAHDRGIVHRDLKPANLLLTDDGRPMLLDFNISDDVVAGGTANLFVGGTLPYMAPEHLRALGTGRGVDARSDVYSFGVILFQLLTGRLPVTITESSEYEVSGEADVDEDSAHPKIDFERFAQTRSHAKTDVRVHEPTISVAVASIVSRCLAPDPAQRYQTMHSLSEDLRRHMEHRPLRFADNTSWRERFSKWRHRHPRLSSLTSAGIVTALIVIASAAALVVQQRSIRRMESQQLLSSVQQSLPPLRVMLSSLHSDPQTLQQGRDRARDVLSQVGQGSIPARVEHGLDRVQQQRLRDNVAELLYLLAASEGKLVRSTDGRDEQGDPSSERWRVAARQNQTAIELYAHHGLPVPEALRVQRTWIQQASAGNAPVTEHLSTVDRLPMGDDANGYLGALELMRQGHPRQAIPLLEQMRQEHRHDFSAWLLLGDAYLSVGDRVDAKSCYDACVTLWPDSPMCYFHRGIYNLYQQQYSDAIRDFDETLHRQSDHTGAMLNRGIAHLRLAKFEAAEQDFSRALDAGATQTRIYFLRARARSGKGDQAGAVHDRQEGMRRTPTDPASCIVRGNEVLKQNPASALKWYETALQLDPASRMAWRNIAHVSAEHHNDSAAAIRMIDRMIENFGQHADDFVSRGVLYARLGNRKAAVADGEAALAQKRSGKILFQVACIYALCVDEHAADAERAIQLVGQAIAEEPRWLSVALRDEDLSSLRGHARFRDLLRSAAKMQYIITSGVSNQGTRPVARAAPVTLRVHESSSGQEH